MTMVIRMGVVGWRIGSKKNGVCFSKSQVGWLDSRSDRKKTGTLSRKPQLDGWMDLFRSFPDSCVEIMVGWLDGGSDRKKTGYVFQNPRLDGWMAGVCMGGDDGEDAGDDDCGGVDDGVAADDDAGDGGGNADD